MTPKVKPKRAGTQWMGYPEQQKKTIRGRSSEANMAPTKNTKETKASKTSQKLANLPRRRERISNQSGRASGHTPRQVSFFMFKVDDRAPLREVQCPSTDRLIHPRRNGSTKNGGSTRTPTSPRDRTSPPLKNY